ADLPQLRALTLRHTVKTLSLLERIVASPLLKRLRRLSLAGGDLNQAAVIFLMRNAEAVRHLELDLQGNQLTPAAMQQIAELCRQVPTAAPAQARGLLSEGQAVARAPDARSLTSARSLARASKWLLLGRDGDRLWGELEGSDHY